MDEAVATDPRPAVSERALDAARLKTLSVPSDSKGLTQLAGHLGLLALTGLAVLGSRGSLWLAPALLAQGIVLVFLFAPLHETIHRTAFRSRRLNDAVARCCGFLLLLPAGYFRAFHLQHHRHTQDPARDPELAGPALASRRAYLIHVSGLPYWRERLTTLCRHAAGQVPESYITARQRPTVIREARGHLAAYGLVAIAAFAGSGGLIVLLWGLPALLGQPFLRLYLLAEHTGCPAVRDMLVNSRTTLSNPGLQALCWHMNRHSAHHAYPGIPFHALPAADRLLAPRIAVRSQGYAVVQREIWRSLGRA